MWCVRCAGRGHWTPAVAVAGGTTVCARHLWGYLFGGREVPATFHPPTAEEC